jgi:predicted GNAT family acetyltransferase
MEGLERLLAEMLDGTLTITVNGQGVKAVIEEQGIAQVVCADTVEEFMQKIANVNLLEVEA